MVTAMLEKVVKSTQLFYYSRVCFVYLVQRGKQNCLTFLSVGIRSIRTALCCAILLPETISKQRHCRPVRGVEDGALQDKVLWMHT